MSRASAQKRIHCVRAVYAPGLAPTHPLERSVRTALTALPSMADTEIANAAIGTLAIRERNPLNPNFVTLAIGLGIPNERMSTIGLNVADAQDANVAQTPAQGRAFKQADAFCLIDENEVLLCIDGSMNLKIVDWYLRSLLWKANLAPTTHAFGLVKTLARDRAKTLEEEGISSIKLNATAYAATEALPENSTPEYLNSGWHAFLRGIREAFEEEAETDAERENLINHFGELNITAVISVKGGKRDGEPVVVESLEEVAKQAINDAPEGTDVVLTTRKGNPVTAASLSIGTTKSIKRFSYQNDLDFTDAWNKLANYRQELIDSHRWKE